MSGRETACPNCGKAALVPPARPQDANAPKLTLPPAIPSKGPSPAQVCVIAQQIIANIETVIVGKREQVTMAVAVLLAEGHLLVEDVPGGETAFRFGPLFAQVVLVDEINRASPRTQAALLEAMGEASITEGKITYRMERPFMVIATQNPIDQEGIFLLPEAQKDRFLVRMSVGYPSLNEEKQMCERFQLRHPIETLKPVTTPDRIVICQNAVREMRLDSDVCDYILALVRATREHPAALLGASPRGSLGLFRAAQAMAAIQGNDFVSIAQVKTLAENVLGHRLIIRADRKHRYHEGVEVIREFLAGKKPDYGPASPS